MSSFINLRICIRADELWIQDEEQLLPVSSEEFLKDLKNKIEKIISAIKNGFTLDSSVELLNQYLISELELEIINSYRSSLERSDLSLEGYTSFCCSHVRIEKSSKKTRLTTCMMKVLDYLKEYGSRIFPGLFKNVSSEASSLIIEAKDNISELIQEEENRSGSSKTILEENIDTSVKPFIRMFLEESNSKLPDFAVPKTCVSSDPNDLDEKEVIKCLTEVSLDILKGKKNKRVSNIFKSCISTIFELVHFEGVVFKCVCLQEKEEAKAKILQRYTNTITVENHMKKNGNYKYIYQPKTKIFFTDNGNRGWIAEEKLPIQSDQLAHCLWNAREKELTPAFVEVAKLIQTVSLNDVKPMNLPAFYRDGKWMLGLIDLEFLNKTSPKEELNALMIWMNSKVTKEAILEVCSPDFVVEYLKNRQSRASAFSVPSTTETPAVPSTSRKRLHERKAKTTYLEKKQL